MNLEFLDFVTFIRFYILLTFILAIILRDKKKYYHKMVLLIIFIGLINEFLSAFLSFQGISIKINTNIYALVNSSLWIYILFKNFKNNFYLLLIIFYLIFGVSNLIFMGNLVQFNVTNFIVGAIIYLIIFIIESYNHLKKENLNFFLCNNYILFSAPVLFFIGFSLMLSFRSKELTSCLILDDIKLYTLVGNFVNIVYYTLINIYILKERKSQNG